MWLFLEKRSTFKKVKNEDHKLSLTLCQSGSDCPKSLKMCLITKFDMGFQKNNIRSRSEKVDYFKNNFFVQTGTKFNYDD